MKKKTNSNYFINGKVKAIFSRFQEKRPILLKVVWPNVSFLAKSRGTTSKTVQTSEWKHNKTGSGAIVSH